MKILLEEVNTIILNHRIGYNFSSIIICEIKGKTPRIFMMRCLNKTHKKTVILKILSNIPLILIYLRRKKEEEEKKPNT